MLGVLGAHTTCVVWEKVNELPVIETLDEEHPEIN